MHGNGPAPRSPRREWTGGERATPHTVLLISLPLFMKVLPFVAAFVGFAASASGAVLATFTFTNVGGVPSLVPTLGPEAIAAGVTVSNFMIGSGAGSPTDEGASSALRITGLDTPSTNTGAALGLNAYYSFTVTIPNDKVVTLTSLSMDLTGTNLFYDNTSANGHNARVYSSLDGFDDVTGDTLARIGFIGSGNPVVNTVPLGGGFATLSGISVTFYMPFIDNSGTATRYLTLDNLVINGTIAVPEPDMAWVGALGAGVLVLRRRRS